MNPLLRRQLRRLWGVENDQSLDQLLSQLEAEDHPVLRTLPQLLMRVGQTYDQFDRDAHLKSRSLELSSQELGHANERLHAQLQERELAVRALRELVDKASHPSIESTSAPGATDTETDRDSMAELSQSVAGLVQALRAERAEQAALQAFIERENKRYETVLDSLREAVFRLDRQGRLVYANQTWHVLTGLGEGWGQKLESCLVPEDHAAWRAMLQQVTLDGERGESCELRLQTPDGLTRWVEVRVQAVTDPEHGAQGYAGTLADITQRHEAATQLAEQLGFVDALFESLPVPAFVKDHRLRYVRVNAAYGRLFALQPTEALGRTTEEAGYFIEDAQHQLHTQEALQSSRAVAFESSLRLRDGRLIDVMINKTALRRESGELIGLLGTCVDITDQKAAGRAMEAARAAAETANRMKSEFLANMSHEIRTPMNGVIGMTELVLATRLNDQQREYLELVRTSAESLMALINEILDFSKIEAGKMTIERVGLDLQRLLMELMRALAPKVSDGRVRLVLDIDPEVPGRLIGDPNRLRQVLNNLLSNAVKFTRRGEVLTTVRVLAQTADGVRLHLSVRDTGIGIANDQVQRIFAPFTQEDASITRRFGGTGLGLTITERLVKMMGGAIAVTSVPGEGSEFAVQLDMPVASLQAPRLSTAQTMHGQHVIVVMEPGSQRDILLRVLRDSGAHPRLISTPQEAHWALSALSASGSRVHAMIISTELPDQRGLDWISDFNGRSPHATADDGAVRPTLLMIGRLGTLPDRSILSNLGVAGGIATPCAPREIHAMLVQAVLGEVSTDSAAAADDGNLPRVRADSPLPRRGRILLAEDHEVNQMLGMALLKGWGHEVELAIDGRQAVQYFERSRFDVVLMDMQMPELSGLEATKLIREFEEAHARPRTPIVALTANAMESDRQRCLDAGMDEHLAKPLRALELQRMLGRVMGEGTDVAPSAPQSPPQETEPPAIVPARPLPDLELDSDFDYAQALREVEPELVAIIGAAFVRNCPKEFDRIQQAIALGAWDDVERTAHSLKGLFLGFEARPLSHVSAQLERTARAAAATPLDTNANATATERATMLLKHLQTAAPGFLKALSEAARP